MVFVQRRNEAPVRQSFRTVMSGTALFEFRYAAAPGAEPKLAGAIFVDRIDIIGRQPVLPSVDSNGRLTYPVKPVRGAYPEIALAVLIEVHRLGDRKAV